MSIPKIIVIIVCFKKENSTRNVIGLTNKKKLVLHEMSIIASELNSLNNLSASPNNSISLANAEWLVFDDEKKNTEKNYLHIFGLVFR